MYFRRLRSISVYNFINHVGLLLIFFDFKPVLFHKILAEWSLILSGFSVVPSLVFKVPLLFQVDKLFSQFVPSRVHWYQKKFLLAEREAEKKL